MARSPVLTVCLWNGNSTSTYVDTQEGWLYLAVVLDLYEIVHYGKARHDLSLLTLPKMDFFLSQIAIQRPARFGGMI
jgi:hypothetical protein